jgi:hypothetical protein
METIDTGKQVKSEGNETEGIISEPFFDETEFYKAEVEPLVKQLQAKCEERNLPMLVKVEHCHKDVSEGKDITSGCLIGILPGARTSPRLRIMAKVAEHGEAAILPALLGSLLGE